MPKLPRISGNNLLKILIKHFGFRILRQKGSHITLTNDKSITVVPMHPELDTGTLNKILKQSDVSREDFFKYY